MHFTEYRCGNNLAIQRLRRIISKINAELRNFEVVEVKNKFNIAARLFLIEKLGTNAERWV